MKTKTIRRIGIYGLVLSILLPLLLSFFSIVVPSPINHIHHIIREIEESKDITKETKTSLLKRIEEYKSSLSINEPVRSIIGTLFSLLPIVLSVTLICINFDNIQHE